MASRRLFLIDAYSYMYRAFYAVRGLATYKGFPTGAIYGFVNMLNKVIKEHKPDYLALALDSSVPTFRHQQYPEYKAHRDRMPEDLAKQIPYIIKIAQAYGLAMLEQPGAEADDVIGTVAKSAEAAGYDVFIVTGDKDLWQLVTDKVRVLDTSKERVFGPEEVEEWFQVPPEKLADLFGIAGDASDNIPGVPGLGKKSAAELISQFGDLETVLDSADVVKGQKRREALKQYADSARLSKELFTIKVDLPLKIDFDELRLKPPQAQALAAIYDELEFVSLKKEILPGADAAQYECRVLNRREEVEQIVNRAKKQAEVALFPLFSGKEAMRGELIGLGIASDSQQAGYLSWLENVRELKGLLEDDQLTKYVWNLKDLLILLSRQGIAPAGRTVDPAVAAYLLDPGQENYTPEALASKYMDYRTVFARKDLKRDSREGLLMVEQRPAEVAGEAAQVSWRLAESLLTKLDQEGLENHFYQVEMPLTRVLADMELTGVELDARVLTHISKELAQGLEELAEEIYALAGEEFNINSPKQLQTILFDKLKLTPVSKTKTGYSTDVSVLEKLAREHRLPGLILDYRSKSKLKSTYVDVLPGLINPLTGRIHSSFNQTVTATGRLSSKNPNLQNIPVKTDLGRRIREAFVAGRGCLLLSADYSQIELRVLAHLSQDSKLMEAFQKDEDVHARTALELFGVNGQALSAQMRAVAKTVNFAVIYGMSPYGLSQQLNIPGPAAKEYIDKYFQTYRGVKEFKDRLLNEARVKGYVSTLTGRRRYLPDVNSANKNIRALAERMAFNTPIQGTAADMIKVAMVDIWKGIRDMESRMILSVHDELIFEAPEPEVEPLKAIVRQAMENALPLTVPVKINISLGKNWGQVY